MSEQEGWGYDNTTTLEIPDNLEVRTIQDQSTVTPAFFNSDSNKSSRRRKSRERKDPRTSSRRRRRRSSTHYSDYSSDGYSVSSQDKNQQQGGFFGDDNNTLEKITGGAEWWNKTSNFAVPSPAAKGGENSADASYSDYYSDAGSDTAPQENLPTAVDNFDPTVLDLAPSSQPKLPEVFLKDKKAPLIWTIGFILICLINTGCSLYPFKSFLPLIVNPFFGPDQTKMLSFGAKYGPFITDGEWWRFGTAMTIHAGVIHIGICVVLIASLYDVERYKGFWPSMLVFLLGGSYGFILSAMFVPNTVQCGANGAVCTWLGFKFVEILLNWRNNHRIARIIILLIELIIIVLMGLLPYNDNFSNIGGLIMGVLAALTLMPNTSTSKCETATRLIVALLAFPVMATLFCLFLVLYWRSVKTDVWCSWCGATTCINFSFANWCPPA